MYALTAKGMKYMDEYAIKAGLPSVVLMENAAKSVAEETAVRLPDRSANILVLAGHGNNGGDAVAAARWLAQMGYEHVEVHFAGKIEKASDSFKHQMSVLANSHPEVGIHGLRGIEKNVLEIRIADALLALIRLTERLRAVLLVWERLGDDVASEFGSRLIKSLYQSVIRHMACAVCLAILVCKKDVVGPEFHFLNLLVFRHGHECSIVHFLDLRPLDRRHDKRVDDHHEEDDQQAVVHH